MNNKSNVERFTGFADVYDKYRPEPPKVIMESLINYIGRSPKVVADLGCGTGLSTLIWSDYSDSVIGVEPNLSMLNKAKEKCNHENISFVLGYGNDTTIDSDKVDIVTCSSAFQWMEPKTTIAEISRILVKEGVFAIYYHDQPPSIDWVVEKAYNELFHDIYTLLDNDEKNKCQLWTIGEYLDIMKNNDNFTFIREIVVHSKFKMGANEFIGFAESQGAFQKIIKEDIPEINDKILRFKETVSTRLEDRVLDSVLGYRVRIAIK